MFHGGGKRPCNQMDAAQLSNRPFKRLKGQNPVTDSASDESSTDSVSETDVLPAPAGRFVFKLNQSGVICGYNRYQAYLGREGIEGGHCQGVSAVWIQKMMEGKYEWFHAVWQKLLNFQFKASFEEDMDVEKFMALVIAAQETLDNAKSYLIKPDSHGGIASSRYGLYLTDQFQASHPKLFKRKYTQDELSKLLKVRRNTIQYLFAGNQHCVAMLMVKGRYVVFDPNYKDAKHKVFENKDHAIAEIKYCLFDDFREVAPSRLKLEVYQFRSQHACAHLPIERITRFVPRDYREPERLSKVRLSESVSLMHFTPQSHSKLQVESALQEYDPKDGLNECSIL